MMEKETTAEKRGRIISLAREKYIKTGRTKNVSEAVRWYLEAHLEECAGIPATITPREADRPRTILDEYDRPPCPKCGKPLFFQVCSTCGKGKRKKNEWVCKACGHRRITKDTLARSLAKLERKKDTGE